MPAMAGDTPAGGTPAPALQKMVGDLHAAARSPVQVLVVDQVNPIFTTPSAWRVREAIEKIPFIVSFASFIDETSALADLILPDHSFLESWVDSVPEAGTPSAVINVAAPVMKPIFDTRAMPDILLDISRRLKMQPALPWQTFEEMLHAGVGSLPPTSPDAGDVWSAAQRQGGWWRETASDAGTRPGAGAATRRVTVAAPQFDGTAAEFPFHFLPYASSAFLDGSLAHLPWLQELPDPMTSAMWSSWVEINPRTADNLKIAPGDVVEITSQHGSVRAPAVVSPAIAPDIVAMPVGQGHRTFTRYASGRGENPIAILAPMSEPETGALAWAATRVKIARAGGPDGHLILFAGEMRERPFGETR